MLLWYLFVFVIVFQTFVDLHRAFSLKRQTVVTCISTLKKSHDEEKAVSCLILGTESSMIYILDPEAFTILDTLIVPAPPSHLGQSILANFWLWAMPLRTITFLTISLIWQRRKENWPNWDEIVTNVIVLKVSLSKVLQGEIVSKMVYPRALGPISEFGQRPLG